VHLLCTWQKRGCGGDGLVLLCRRVGCVHGGYGGLPLAAAAICSYVPVCKKDCSVLPLGTKLHLAGLVRARCWCCCHLQPATSVYRSGGVCASGEVEGGARAWTMLGEGGGVLSRERRMALLPSAAG
jgi:hypothetical protein